MAWLQREKAPISKGQKSDIPAGLWLKCQNCGAILYRKDFEEAHNVCSQCGHHYALDAKSRISMLLDSGSIKNIFEEITSCDPLGFSDRKPYKTRIEETATKLGHNQDAIICAQGSIFSIPVCLGVFEFAFMGGSMGSVVGEKIARLFLKAADERVPALVVSSSGGARMQEGILSLMQMAKTCAALSSLRDAGMPFISILTNPTTGGVAASYAMLGDINIGEPNALIGFAGPRVIQQTIREKLPEGFQRSEYLLEHGMLDMICKRHDLKDKLGSILSILLNKAKQPPANA